MKHIESIQPEYAADDMTALLLSDATASAALTALLHNATGCAIPPTATIPESEVEELVPLCLSILRRHWTTPLTALGDGTTPMSLADLMRRLIGDRVDGNESLGIPPANANIPTAVSALRQRDMSSGLTLTLTDGGADGSTPTTTSLPDGLSLAQLLCSGLADNITELQDSNTGWTMGANSKVQSLLSICKNIEIFNANCTGELNRGIFNNHATIRVISMPFISSMVRYASSLFAIGNCANLEEVILPSATYVYAHSTPDYPCIHNCPNLRKLVLGRLTDYRQAFWSASSENLIHFEIGEGTGISLDFSHWTATTALSERLPEFLSNFKQFIAQRLTDKGSGLTLTLSQAVRDAIQTDPEIVSIITSKGWTISPAPSV